ncbi:gliding motility-associated peptidyl-prolyl isomerase GldI [Lutibacter citreus]|uniref:gliding motility-associated peptidyl-prolyl isomerase GldI n=1 Tax=Lutibacter citreus TaxID=2138210 RepID=UPI000DBE8DBB|nr:gliding motility-associated peptidyl-prolyl isomerase GldI [Lutibacter citreus]
MKHNFFILLLIPLLLSCEAEPRRAILRKSSSGIKKSILLNKNLIANQESDFRKIMKQDSLNNYLASDFGFWYKINYKSKENYFPKNGDEIIYTYEVFSLNDKIIYNNKEVGIQKYVTDNQEIVEGLREGLKLMNIGDNITFLFPSHKVFGYLGDKNKVGINQPLIYKVQLIKINKKNESN